MQQDVTFIEKNTRKLAQDINHQKAGDHFHFTDKYRSAVFVI